MVAVELAAVRKRLRAAGKEDLAAWERVRAFLREAVGESTFEIWLASLELIAVDLEGALVVSASAETVGWVARRFGRVLDSAAQRAGRGLRIASEIERQAAEPVSAAAAAHFSGSVSAARRVADTAPDLSGDVLTDMPGGGRGDQSARQPTYRSAYPSSYTEVHTQTKEVS